MTTPSNLSSAAPGSADSLAQRALALCRVASPIGHEQALADDVEAWAKRHFEPSQLLRVSHSLVLGGPEPDAPQRAKRPLVALIGHLDTVPAHPGMLPPRLEQGRLHGLGSSDMKGGLAVMMALAETLPRASLPYNVVWVFYEREEGPYLESGLGPLFERAPWLRSTALGIAMEPTDNVIQVGCVGSLHATLRFTGRSAHSARPWQGENAIHKAGALLQQLAELAPREVEVGGFVFREVFSVTLAKGGRTRNVIPDGFELNLNYRFAPGKKGEEAKQDVLQLVAGRAEVDFTDVAPSGRACVENPLYQRLVAASGARTEAKQAWTDVGRLSELGVDAVNFGPGETAQAHQQDESAGVALLGEAYEKLERFLRGAAEASAAAR